MYVVESRRSNTCSHRSGFGSQSRASYQSGSRDIRRGSASYVIDAVETVVDGFTKTSKDKQHKSLSVRLSLDNKPLLRASRLSWTKEECMRTSPRSRSTNCRPVSAPTASRRRQLLTRSATCRTGQQVRSSTPVENDAMFDVVKAVKDAKNFQEDIELFQNLEKSLKNPEGDEKKDSAPVFNKRLFVSQGTVIMTEEARRLMAVNSRLNQSCDTDMMLSKRELQCLRCVTEGLKLIHKGHDFVKDVLSRVITFEVYKSFQYVPHKSWEDSLSCYYILNGAVEVTYDLRSRESRNVYQENIIYSHGTGEYLGLVSPEGPREDLAPPATIYTKELTQFIRVDRQRFHKLMQKATAIVDKQKRDYLQSRSFLTKVSENVKEKLLHKFTIQEFAPNRVLLTQGEITEFLFVVMSGRCQTYREVYIPEADKEVLFYLTSRDTDDFFGEECVLDIDPSYCTVVAATTTVCLKLHRSALKMVNRDKLRKFIEAERHEFITDQELRDMGYKDCVWNKFKHGQIKETLREGGKLCYLSKDKCTSVLERPPSDDEVYTENKRRFVLKGSQFEPVRTQSAIVRGSQYATFPVRPHTVLGNHPEEEKENSGSQLNENAQDSGDVSGDTSAENNQSSLMTVAKAKELEKHIEKTRYKRLTVARIFYQAMESKETLMKLLEEHGDMGLHIKQAWKSEYLQETQNFMKNGVLVTMTSEDIVRKAKALADSYADKWKKNSTENEEEEWNTILHAENKQAKMLITANKMRLKDLKRRMTELQKRRERERERRSPRKSDQDINADRTLYEDQIEEQNGDQAEHVNGDIQREAKVSTESNSINHRLENDDQRSADENKLSIHDDEESGANDAAMKMVNSEDILTAHELSDENNCFEASDGEKAEHVYSNNTLGEHSKHISRSVISSRPDSAIESLGSEDTGFDGATITDTSNNLDDSSELENRSVNSLKLVEIQESV